MAHPQHVATLLLVASSLGCKDLGGSSTSSGSDDEQSQDLVEGCTPLDEMFGEVHITPTNIETVLKLDWMKADNDVYVAFRGEDGGILRTAPTTRDADVLLLGNLPDDVVHIQLVTDQPNRTVCSAVYTAETGALPPSMPELALSEYDETRATTGFTAAPIITEDGTWVTVLDELGRVVWATFVADTVLRVKFSQDGQSVLYFTGTSGADIPGHVTRMGFDGVQQGFTGINGAHIDFDELGDGGFVAVGWEIREFEVDQQVRKLLGDTVEIVSPSGEQQRIWSAFDEWTPDLSQEYPTSWYLEDDTVEDWSHGNGISYDAATDQVLVSVARFDAVVALDRSTGERQWLIAAEDAQFPSDADVVADADTIVWPHSAHLDEDGSLLVFDRHSITGDECAQADRYDLDPQSGAFSHPWQFTTDSCMVVSYLGEAHPLPGDNVLVVWTTAGQLDQATPEADSVWRVNTELGAAIGFSDFTTSLY